jgi:hypothetical protein
MEIAASYPTARHSQTKLRADLPWSARYAQKVKRVWPITVTEREPSHSNGRATPIPGPDQIAQWYIEIGGDEPSTFRLEHDLVSLHLRVSIDGRPPNLALHNLGRDRCSLMLPDPHDGPTELFKFQVGAGIPCSICV